MSKPSTPIVLLGRHGQLGSIVTQHLLPEIEVIHFVSTPQAAHADLPKILASQHPSNPSGDGVGTQDYSRAPQAVVAGLGYHNDIIDELRTSCRGAGPGVPWIVGGLSKAQVDDMFAGGSPPSPEVYGPRTAAKVKSKILQLIEDGQGERDGVHRWYES